MLWWRTDCGAKGGNRVQGGGDHTVQVSDDGDWTMVGAEEVRSARFWIM